MQGWDQPATGMETDLGWVSSSRVSGFSQGETHPLWEGEPERSVPESLHCAAGAEEGWRSTWRGCSPGRCWAAAGHRLLGCLGCANMAGEDCSPSVTGSSLPG